MFLKTNVSNAVVRDATISDIDSLSQLQDKLLFNLDSISTTITVDSSDSDCHYRSQKTYSGLIHPLKRQEFIETLPPRGILTVIDGGNELLGFIRIVNNYRSVHSICIDLFGWNDTVSDDLPQTSPRGSISWLDEDAARYLHDNQENLVFWTHIGIKKRGLRSTINSKKLISAAFAPLNDNMVAIGEVFRILSIDNHNLITPINNMASRSMCRRCGARVICTVTEDIWLRGHQLTVGWDLFLFSVADIKKKLS